MPFCAVVRTMLETGRDLPSLCRETSQGGRSKFVVRQAFFYLRSRAGVLNGDILIRKTC